MPQATIAKGRTIAYNTFIMRIRLELEAPGNKLLIPANYNHLLQAMIYANVSEKLAGFLHDEGFPFEKRNYKLFTFSRLFGNSRVLKPENTRSDLQIEFESPVHFFLSTPFERMLKEFANRMVSGESVRLGENHLAVSSVEILQPPVFGDRDAIIRMLSPVTMRSTLKKESGDSLTHYYSPLEKDFSRLIRENILKKYVAFNVDAPPEPEFEIIPEHFSLEQNAHELNYKGFLIKAYDGIFRLCGSGPLKLFAYDTGLGERSSQGFGMFEILKKNLERI